MQDEFRSLREKLLRQNLKITERMEEQFSAYYKLLMEWNKVMNLTAVTEFDEAADKHFFDSVILGAYMDLNRRLSVIDVGTGAGFPGIPLKIVYPELKIVLADSLNKRIRFLNEVILRLELEGIAAVHGRAEELARKEEYRGQFDLCVSRAVANLACLSEYCIPFLKTGGVFVSYKSGSVESEVSESKRAVSLLGGRLREVKKFRLPGTAYHRSFIFIDKAAPTVEKYPRRAGIPARQPLGIAIDKGGKGG